MAIVSAIVYVKSECIKTLFFEPSILIRIEMSFERLMVCGNYDCEWTSVLTEVEGHSLV